MDSGLEDQRAFATPHMRDLALVTTREGPVQNSTSRARKASGMAWYGKPKYVHLAKNVRVVRNQPTFESACFLGHLAQREPRVNLCVVLVQL